MHFSMTMMISNETDIIVNANQDKWPMPISSEAISLALKLSLGVYSELICHMLRMDSQIQFGNQ